MHPSIHFINLYQAVKETIKARNCRLIDKKLSSTTEMEEVKPLNISIKKSIPLSWEAVKWAADNEDIGKYLDRMERHTDVAVGVDVIEKLKSLANEKGEEFKISFSCEWREKIGYFEYVSMATISKDP